ncbi:MAG: hypothetical protein KBT27_03690, partial [Prevotellaceae bacterium]|nr:hypothetical protein [Candidatus Faecinaster equi]
GGSQAKFGGEAYKSESYTFLYPYQGEADIVEGKIKAVIPVEQTAKEGSFDPAANLSVATADGKGVVNLKDICSLIRLNVAVNCASVTLTDLDGRAVAGAVTINPATGEAKAAAGASKSVTLKNLEAGKIYYIAILPGAIRLNLEFRTSAYEGFIKSKASQITLERSKVLNVGQVVSSPKEEWVEIAGLKWATCNVGATSPVEKGGYYAWGETTTKTSYTSSNYTYEDNPDVLPLEADAAHVILGGKWRMPTKEDLEELYNNCCTQYTSNYNKSGKTGVIVYKPKNDADKGKHGGLTGYSESDVHIFFPMNGYYQGGSVTSETIGYYRTSTKTNKSTTQAWITTVISNSIFNIQDSYSRNVGMAIRPVYDKNL